MTAIFTMWNRNGFSLASDSNQTANEMWIDPVEKIFALKDHQIAIASAGNATVNDVEILELFRKWEKTLHSRLDSLDDYVIDFLVWYFKEDFEHFKVSVNQENFLNNIDYDKKLFQDRNMDIKSLSYEEIFNLLSEDLGKFNRSQINIYCHKSVEFELVGFNPDLIDDFSDKFSHQKSFDILSAVAEKVNLDEDFERRCFIFKSHNIELLRKVFLDLFDCEFDPESEWQNALIDSEVFYQMLKMPSEVMPASILIVGYGEKDWVPKSAKLSFINDSGFGGRRTSLKQFSSPDHVWYVGLAIETATESFIQGFSEALTNELKTNLKDYVKKGKLDELMVKIDEFGSSRFGKVLTKMEMLTVDRLEYVARLFVQLEALQSYLGQPLPGVGGDVSVITMTKTTRKEKKYPELPV